MYDISNLFEMKPIKEKMTSLIIDTTYREVWNRVCAGGIPGKLSQAWPDVEKRIHLEIRDKILQVRRI